MICVSQWGPGGLTYPVQVVLVLLPTLSLGCFYVWVLCFSNHVV
jgi:hypothetical protein